MTISEALSDTSIDRMVELADIAKDKFGDKFKSSSLRKNFKTSYDGVVETKDGQLWTVKVKIINPKFTTTSWKRLA